MSLLQSVLVLLLKYSMDSNAVLKKKLIQEECLYAFYSRENLRISKISAQGPERGLDVVITAVFGPLLSQALRQAL